MLTQVNKNRDAGHDEWTRERVEEIGERMSTTIGRRGVAQELEVLFDVAPPGASAMTLAELNGKRMLARRLFDLVTKHYRYALVDLVREQVTRDSTNG